MPDLTETEYHVFLSHSSKDKKWVDNLVARLDEEEWEGHKFRVFYSPRDIRAGESNTLRIEEALLASRVVVLVMTPDSMKSPWVEDERVITHDRARSKGTCFLIPVLYKDCDPPPLLKSLCRINFTDSARFEEKYRELVAAIKASLSAGCRLLRPSDESVLVSRFIPHPPPTGYVPRHNDEQQDMLKVLTEALAPGENRLVALWGPGGMGKTTLAVMVARQMYEDFAGRVVWVNAGERVDFSLSTLLDDIATRLGRVNLRASSLEQKKAQIGELVNRAPTLIVLDNFETIEPEEQRNCELWLAADVSCSVLITTRERIRSARNFAVKGMTPAEAREFLRLLIEQEEQDRSAFDGLDRDRIVAAAEYNPLVLRWIVEQIAGAQEPEGVLRELAQGRGGVAERVFDLSFNLPQVGDDGRAVLLALYLLRSRASRRALAAVAGLGDDPERFNRAVKKLSDLWLIQSREGNGKFFIRGLTRERIKKHLDASGRADEFSRRFIDYFLKYAEGHSRHAEEDFLALEDEKKNGANAMVMAFRQKDWKSVLKFFVALEEFLDRRTYWTDLIEIGERSLFAARAAIEEGLPERDPELDEMIRRFPQIIGIDHQDRELAAETYKEALRFYKTRWRASLKDPEERKTYAYQIGITAHQVGVLRQYEGKFDKARGWYRWAGRFKEECKSPRGFAAILNNLGVIAEHEGRLAEAADLYRRALSLFNELRPPSPYAVITERNLKRVEALSSRATP